MPAIPTDVLANDTFQKGKLKTCNFSFDGITVMYFSLTIFHIWGLYSFFIYLFLFIHFYIE